MKTFSLFLESTAVQQATRMGLVSDGHGGWYDKKGEFIAKTERGQLKFFNKRQRQGQDPRQSEKEKRISTSTSAETSPEQEAGQQDAGIAPPQVEKTRGTLTIAFGRFNPPTTGHEKLLKSAGTEASRTGADLRIYPSRSVDAKKNPLQPGTKIEYMQKMFPDFAEDIKDDPNAKTIFDVLIACQNLAYKSVTIVVGQDRLAEFQGLAQKYNGDLYDFEEIKVISAGQRDADAEGLEGMSASKMRDAAAKDDFKAFAKGIPNIGNMDKKNLYNILQKSMGVKKTELAAETWTYAPKLDPFGLRVAYLKEQCFKVGSLVENVNTGVRGRITRRCANHVIVQTPEHTMFKAWLKDLTEAYDVGTDEYRRYVQSMTPGQGDVKFHDKPDIKPITTGSYYDGKKVKNPNDPPSGPGTKYNDTKIPYKVGKG